MRPHRLIALLVACLLPVLLPAQTSLIWDPNGTVTGTGTGGGTWDTTTANWTTDAYGESETQVWVNDGTVSADIRRSTIPSSYESGSSYTIDVAAAIKARGIGMGLSAWNTNTVITFSGSGSLTLTDPAFNQNNGTSAINVPLISTGGLNISPSVSNFAGIVQLNTANPDLLGVTTISKGTLLFNHPGALGPETTGNGIVIGNGTLQFGYVSGGDFTYSLADPVSITGSGQVTISYDSGANRSATLTGPISLEADAHFVGGTLNGSGTAKVNSSGVISETSEGRNIYVQGDVGLSGANTFTGKVYVGDGYSTLGRITVATFNNDGAAGPLGAGSGLQLGYDAGEGGANGEIFYTGGTASSTRSIQIVGGTGVIGVTNAASALTLTGVISGSGGSTAHILQKGGPGTLVLRGNNTFTGRTDLVNGTLVVGHNNALGTGTSTIRLGYTGSNTSDNVSFLLENGVTFSRKLYVYNNNSSGSTTIGMTGTGSSTYSGEVYLTRPVDVKVDSGATQTFSGYLNDGVTGGSVTKTGAGLAEFNGGVDLRGGSFKVNAGELRLNGEVVVSGSVRVYAGGTLSGNGTIYETVLVSGGGTLSPGNSGAGVMTMDSIYLANGGTSAAIKWQLASLTTSRALDTPQFDRIVVTSDGNEIYPTVHLDVDLSLLGISSRPDKAVALNDPFWQSVQTWSVIDFSGAGSDNLAAGYLHPIAVANGVWTGGVFDTFVGGGTGAFAEYASGDIFLRFTPVPEPSTWVLLGLGGAALLLPRLRRRN